MITGFSPLGGIRGDHLWADPGQQLTFSAQLAAGVKMENGAAVSVPAAACWNASNSGWGVQGGTWTLTPFASESSASPTTVQVCAVPQNMRQEDIPAYVAGLDPSEIVTWTIWRSDPMPKLQRSLAVVPYNGTGSGTGTATLQIGGSAQLTASLATDNNPSAFTYSWEYQTPESATWLPVSGFAGLDGPVYTTPLMTPGMDGYQYRVTATNTANQSLHSSSDPVVVRVDREQMAPSVTIPKTSPRYSIEDGMPTVEVPAGRSMTLNAEATVPHGLTPQYQWQRAEGLGENGTAYYWTDIPGATGRQYVLDNVAASDNDDVFRCEVSVAYDADMSTSSDPVELNVTSGTDHVTVSSITADGEPVDLAVYTPGCGLELEVTATGSGEALEYQWYRAQGSDSTDAGESVGNGGTSARYVPTDLAPGVWYYWCDVSGVLSNSIQVVYPRGSTTPSTPTGLPSTVDAEAGTTVEITANSTVGSGDDLEYVWETLVVGGDPEAGRWHVLAGSNSATLRIPNVTESMNGSRYRCLATNPATQESSAASGECILYVFPRDSYVAMDDPPASTVLPEPLPVGSSISASVRVLAGDNLQLYEYYWSYSATADGTYAPLQPSSVTPPATTTTLAQLPISADNGSTLTIGVPLQLAPDSATKEPDTYYYARQGYYRLNVVNTSLGASSSVYPTTVSAPAYVLVQAPGEPYVATQPQDQMVAQGRPATFTVAASLGGGTPAYRWQKWVYTPTVGVPGYGYTAPSQSLEGTTGYWANCDDGDGAGISTASFTTVATTPEMRVAAYQGNPMYYRCLVYNRASGGMVPSSPALLSVDAPVPVVPGLDPMPGSGLSIGQADGATYLRGLVATASGTTAGTVLNNMEPSRNCTMEIVTASGEAAGATSPVCTGYVIRLLDRDGGVLDSAPIVVDGDVLGRGRIELSQLVKMAAVYSQTDSLARPYLLAGLLAPGSDRTGLSLSDLVVEAQMYRQYVLGGQSSTQW